MSNGRPGVLLGVDGGTTKTLAFVAHPDGSIAGVGRSGCGDLYNAESPEEAIAAIVGAAATALEAAGAGGGDVVGACFSLGGADWPEDFELLGRELPARLGLPGDPMIVNDAIGAIRAGTDDGVGLAVVCGTGGAPGARNAAGEVYHVGFWPDSTGAWGLGNAGLNAVWRADLELGPETSLTGRALELYGVSSPMELLHEFTRRGGFHYRERFRIVPAVLDEADAGDEVAHEIVCHQARVLGRAGAMCARRVGLDAPYPVVLAGGVFRHPTRLVRDTVMAEIEGCQAVAGAEEPVTGALLFAFDRAGIAPDRERLAATRPHASIFATVDDAVAAGPHPDPEDPGRERTGDYPPVR